MNIIFLGIDGVLNSRRFRRKAPPTHPQHDPAPAIEPAKVSLLNALSRLDNVGFVLTCDWRDSLITIPALRLAGFCGRVVGRTPRLPATDPWQEIDAWLAHDTHAINAVILDHRDMGALSDLQVCTDPDAGLTRYDAAEASYVLVGL